MIAAASMRTATAKNGTASPPFQDSMRACMALSSVPYRAANTSDDRAATTTNAAKNPATYPHDRNDHRTRRNRTGCDVRIGR